MRDKPTVVNKLEKKNVNSVSVGRYFTIALGDTFDRENTVIIR
jgi:hypothetical protein